MKLTKITLALALPFVAMHGLFASNTITKVEQVVEGVTVSADVDYTIANNEPFATAGSVDITNTEHAVVIISNVKPSKVISTWLKNHVYINGKQAVNGSNCQVKMYGNGAIILPYASTIKPLTVFSEQNYQGTSVNDFGLENDGGFMNTLSEEKLNNKIRSFKLKRGYMVTFSTRAGGRGYSRCFIADKADLEIAKLPAVLDKTISSYRVFHWYNAKKAGLASDTGAGSNALVNSSWCYSWGLGESRLPDQECVPNHIYEDWPSAAACGGVTYSCHMKTNNEPGNSADDHPQDVATVLANWENLMRTGMRLCSESSHDGSMNHLKAFIDSIDARGWRCDILDLHCYWPAGSFNNLNSYSDNYGNGRPIWISEWVWGASWNNNGAFAVSNRSDYEGNWDNNYNGTKPILDLLNKNSRVERYAFWNSEANCSKILLNGKLSKLGEYYATMGDGLGYNAANEFIPRNPRQYAPSNLMAAYDGKTKKVKLTWHDENGEYNQSMTVQVKVPGGAIWTTLMTPEQNELPSNYECEVDGLDGYKYRICITDLSNVKRYSNEATAVNENLQPGDAVSVGTNTFYIGGNMLVNGDFDLGLTDWENGAGNPLAAPYFEVVPMGGMDGGAYLQAYGNSSDRNSEQSVKKILNLEKYTNYYVQAAGCNGSGTNQKIATSTIKNMETSTKVAIPAMSIWSKQGVGFKTSKDTILSIGFRDCNGTSQFDKIIVSRLFSTQDSALADALECAKKRAEAFKAYFSDNKVCVAEIDELLATTTSHADIEECLQRVLEICNNDAKIKSLVNNANYAVKIKAQEYKDVENALKELTSAATTSAILESYGKLDEAVAKSMVYARYDKAIQNPLFASDKGWNTVSGTYKGGDQRLATQAGKTCWNAWWSTAAGPDVTMAVNQDVTKLPHGFYALEAKATTQHQCVADQKAFVKIGDETAYSPRLSYGVLDLPSFGNAEKWETLVTPYVYVADGDTLNVGFIGTKDGAVDKSWMAYANPANKGDNREGWWCATDFLLRQIPAFCVQPDESGWGTICLQSEFEVPEGMTLYQIAGILADSTRICIEPATTFSAGTPYIYKTDSKEAFYIFETGKRVTTVNTNYNGLRGMVQPTTKYPKLSLVLVGDRWKCINEEEERTPIKHFSGFVYKQSYLKVLDSWDGEVMWTKDLVSEDIIQELIATGISSPEMTAEKSAGQVLYNVSGQRVGDKAKGIVVAKGKKVVKK